MRIGDRYTTVAGNVVEIIGIDSKIKFLVIEMNNYIGSLYSKPGDIFQHYNLPPGYSTLGNFSKARNVTNLYKLLSGW